LLGLALCLGCAEPNITNSQPWVQPPPPSAADLIAGDSYVCALISDGSVRCTGVTSVASLTDLVQISGGLEHACGVRISSAVACWGVNRHTKMNVVAGQYQQVTAGTQHTCGLRVDGSIACWGLNDEGQTDVPEGLRLRSVLAAVGGHHTCGLTQEGEIRCWGMNARGQASPPAGTYEAVTAGAFGGCALDSARRILCWGDPIPGIPADGGVGSISAGPNFLCAARNGRVSCWGASNPGNVLETPDETDFVRVVAGYDHACGLRGSGRVKCWGSITAFPGVAQ
jgi:alpha-tubulin suppressor-like RCC1 family protein